MALVQTTCRIDGEKLINPREWLQQKVVATYENDIVQPNITIERFSFVKQDALKIKEHINKGFIFEGLPFSIEAQDEGRKLTVFDGFLDLVEDFEVKSENEVIAKAKKIDGLNNLSQLLQANTVGYLESIGVYSSRDYQNIEYLVEKKINIVELAITSVTIYLLGKQIAESVKQLADDIADFVAHISGGYTGFLAAAVWSAVKIIINATYAIALINALIKMLENLLENLLPIVRKHKGISLYNLIAKAIQNFGYTFFCPIPEMKSFVYLPSRPFNGEPIKKGIPNIQDFGYNLSDAMQLCLRLFNAKIQVIGNEVHLRWVGDTYWRKNSTYQLPNVLIESYSYNTQDLVSNKLYSYQTDIADDWTIDNYEGTSFGVNISPKTVKNKKLINIKNFDDISFPVALGSRKDGLNELEKVLKEVASLVDSIANTKFAKKIENRVGMLKVSSPNHSVPKLLVIENGRIPQNYKKQISAKSLYEKYHAYSSFVSNPTVNQKINYQQVRIPFNLQDFLELSQNSYFTTHTGALGKMNKVEWEINSDVALVDFSIEQQYTENLKETFVEQNG